MGLGLRLFTCKTFTRVHTIPFPSLCVLQRTLEGIPIEDEDRYNRKDNNSEACNVLFAAADSQTFTYCFLTAHTIQKATRSLANKSQSVFYSSPRLAWVLAKLQ